MSESTSSSESSEAEPSEAEPSESMRRAATFLACFLAAACFSRWPWRPFIFKGVWVGLERRPAGRAGRPGQTRLAGLAGLEGLEGLEGAEADI